MTYAGLWLRVFVALLFAVLPPILILVGAVLLTESLLSAADPTVIAGLVVLATVAWAAMLGIVYSRVLGSDMQSLVALAQRGPTGTDGDPGGAHAALARALDERNRQVATLARQSGLVPIIDDPRRVATDLVSTVQDVLQDSTWSLAVLSASSPDLLPTGIYPGPVTSTIEQRAPVGEMEQWASVTDSHLAARLAEGPWGRFAVVDVSAGSELSAVLYAPWEGRPDPSPADLDLMQLVGQHAATALEHSLLYARVRTQADELERLSTIQSDFLRGVTHDLQTPLTSIGALAAELRASPDLPEQASADLDTITHQADRLRRMVAQLLIASRLEAGAFSARQEVFAVSPIIERTWKALRADRPFALRVEGQPHLAIGDPDRLEQVLWAVLDNAVKYSPADSPVAVVVRPEDERLAIEVRDQGAGMDEPTLENAFEQFFRSTAARRMAPDGSGVGLYAARGLLHAMGGSISATSSLGSGTTVTVHVPAEVSAETAE